MIEIIEPVKKKCTRCSEIAGAVVKHPLIKFYKNKTGKYGVCNNCKECHKIMGREWKERNPERAKEILAKSRKTAKAKLQASRPPRPPAKTPEHYLEYAKNYSKTYYALNRESILARIKEKRANENINNWLTISPEEPRTRKSRAKPDLTPKGQKKCGKCSKAAGETVYHLLEFFYGSTTGKFGKGASCKTTEKAALKVKRDAERAKDPAAFDANRKAKRAIYREKSKDKIKASRKNYYQDHKEEIKEKNKLYRLKNPEKSKAQKAKYRKNNPDKIEAQRKKWYEENKDPINARRTVRRAEKKAERLNHEKK